jgi:predicted peptidase
MDISNWATNRGDWDGGQTYVSADKLAEIVDLLEEAYSQEYEVDRDRLLLIACSRVENLAPSYY